MLFSESFSFINFNIHVDIPWGPERINLSLLFFVSVSSTKLLWIYRCFWRNCFLEIFTTFLPFLPSIETAILNPFIINFVLNFNWNFISPLDFFKFTFPPFQNILAEFRRPNFNLFCKSCMKCFIIKLITKNFIQ